MPYGNKGRFFILMMMIGILISGCGNVDITERIAQITNQNNMTSGSAPEFDYTVPVSHPSILTDQIGYLPDSTKIAIFVGSNVPSSFQVINQDTGESVYTSTIGEKGTDNKSGKEVSYGTFTDLTQEGSYIIKCDVIGYSYPFEIGEDVYIPLKEELIERLGDAEDAMTGNQSQNGLLVGGLEKNLEDCGDVVTECEMADVLLLAYELYPDYFDQNMDGTAGGVRIPQILELIRSATDWMVTMQDPDYGGIYSGQRDHGGTGADSVVSEDERTQNLSTDATAYFAATMAKFSYQYQQYDATYADKCLSDAELAWEYLKKQDSQTTSSEMLFAASELYRITGKTEYHNYILTNKEFFQQEITDECGFLGAITYLSTTKNVDTIFCNSLISNLMEDSESISKEAENNLFQIDSRGEGTEIQNILWNMIRISVIDYVITNHEYSTVIENNVHYILGSNSESFNYLDDISELENDLDQNQENSIRSLPQTAEMLFLLETITSEKEMITSS